MLQDILSTGNAIFILYESYKPEINPSIYVLLMSFFAYDLICNKLTIDFKIHHIITSSFGVISLLYPYSPELRLIMSRAEWSTLALNAIPYVPYSCQNGVRLLFFILFFKFRIIDWYYMFQEHTFLRLQLFPVLALYSLNLYWFILICKKLAKPLKNISLHVVNQHIVSYTMMINSLFINTIYPTVTFCKIMTLLLGISSYLYHKEIAYENDGIPTMNSKWILLDISVFHIFKGGYMYLLNYSCSPYIHALNVWYIYKFLPSDSTYASMPSFGIDMLLMMYDNPSIELFTISLLILYIHILNPFYDVSYVSTHLVLCWFIHNRTNHLLENYYNII